MQTHVIQLESHNELTSIRAKQEENLGNVGQTEKWGRALRWEPRGNLVAAWQLATTWRAVTMLSDGSGRAANRCGSLSRDAGMSMEIESNGFGKKVGFLEVVI